MSDTLDERLESRANDILALLANTDLTRPRRLRSPEFRKNLDRLCTAVRDTQRLRRAGLLESDHEEQLERLLLTPKELTTLNSDALGLLLESVDQVLVDAGDEKLLDALLETEYLRDKDERKGPIPTWSTIHGENRPTELADKKRDLSTLLRVRHSIYSLRRAREGTKATRLVWLAPILWAMVGAFIALGDWVADEASWREGLLVAVAGAMGATLAAAFKARDTLPRLSDLRTFWYGFALQVPIGAVAGLFLWIVLESGVVEVAGSSGEEWAVAVALAFVAGFSEPFLFNIVERIAGGGADDKTK
ncbi:MAG: hypothetical protein M3P42_02410 [Actinomycetota bacterium]|nr:hypothetical protein [Actinomycetota bacterium]